MFPVAIGRFDARRFAVLSALALALTGVVGNSAPVGAEVVHCAVGGDLANGGSGVGCVFGGTAGAAIAGEVHTADPTMTVAASFGAPYGYPALSVAGQVDLTEPSVEIAGTAGGKFPHAAEAAVVAYP